VIDVYVQIKVVWSWSFIRSIVLGRSQDALPTPSQNLQQQAQVVAVGIAAALPEELAIIATDPERNVFMIENFDELGQFAQDISDAVCFAGRTEDEAP